MFRFIWKDGSTQDHKDKCDAADYYLCYRDKPQVYSVCNETKLHFPLFWNNDVALEILRDAGLI